MNFLEEFCIILYQLTIGHNWPTFRIPTSPSDTDRYGITIHLFEDSVRLDLKLYAEYKFNSTCVSSDLIHWGA